MVEPDVTVDARGLYCPIPVLRLAKAFRDRPLGTVALLLATDPAAVEDGYVTGLEPSTGFPNNRRIERKAGRVPKLGPGESRKFAIDFEVVSGTDAVGRAAAEIAVIQAGRETQLESAPERIE